MKKAFSLVELVVVIAIIIVLGAIVTPAAFKAVSNSKITEMVKNYQAIKSASFSLYNDTKQMPDTCFSPGHPCESENLFVKTAKSSSKWNGPYLQNWPTPPWENIGLLIGKLNNFMYTGSSEEAVLGTSATLEAEINQRLDKAIDKSDGLNKDQGDFQEQNFWGMKSFFLLLKNQ